MKHTVQTLTEEFWSRRKPGEFAVRLSVKQVAWLRNLLHDADPKMPSSHTYVLPVNGLPRALVVYPNGAGFVKVEDFAMEHVDGKWRVKPQYASEGGAA